MIVFFVLSGFVLSIAASRGTRFLASRYYPNRLVRLYVPVLGAVIVAALIHEAVSHDRTPGATIWLNQHATPLGLGHAIHDITLIFGAGDGGFTTVLWSLRWEVLFSLLLPAYLIAAKRRPLLCAGLSVAAILAYGPHNDYVHYMPTFMLGTALAFGHPRVAAALSTRATMGILVASLLCLSANWWMPAGFGVNVGMALTALGATGLLICAMNPGAFAGLLNSRAFQLVGGRSFSLYLVHEPLLVAVAFALGGKPAFVVLAALSLPLIVLLTEGFYRLVERPAHRLAHRIVLPHASHDARGLRTPAVAENAEL